MAEIQDLDPTDANNTGRWPENMTYGAVNDAGRADEGILARWYQDIDGSLTASGSSNAYAVTSNRTIASLVNNTGLVFTANHTNTGAATFNLNGLGAKDIRRFNGQALSAGDIISGQPVWVVYKSSLDYWFMLTAPAAIVTSMFVDLSENGSPGDPSANVLRAYSADDSGTTVLGFRDSAGFVSLLRRAVQSEMEAASSDNRYVTPAVQHYHPGHPKCWGYATVSGGTPTLQASYNITSITDDGTGLITFTIATDFSSANWCGVLGGGGGNMTENSKAAGSVQLRNTNSSGTNVDPDTWGFAGFGDHA